MNRVNPSSESVAEIKDNTSVVMNRKERDLVSSPLAPTAGRWMDVANGEDDSGCHPLLHWFLLV